MSLIMNVFVAMIGQNLCSGLVLKQAGQVEAPPPSQPVSPLRNDVTRGPAADKTDDVIAETGGPVQSHFRPWVAEKSFVRYQPYRQL
jgi:hypothetical protein